MLRTNSEFCNKFRSLSDSKKRYYNIPILQIIIQNSNRKSLKFLKNIFYIKDMSDLLKIL